jgi:hypothetical protein
MQLTVNFNEDGADEKRVAEIFDVTGTALQQRMEALAAAAMEEYNLAFSGVRAPSTIKEQRELRLRLLYKHLPAGEPTDTQIGRLFQMTPAQVGTLIAGTRARFDVDVETRLKKAAIDALTNKATKIADDKVRLVVDDSLGRFMRDLVNQTDAPPFEKVRTAARTYEPTKDTLRALCQKLGIDPAQITVLKWK